MVQENLILSLICGALSIFLIDNDYNNKLGLEMTETYQSYIENEIDESVFVNKFGEEASRKYVHILLSNVWIIYLFFIDSMWAACVLPIAFVFINLFSYKFKLINI